uniref:BSDC1 protein n=1 Tax=Junco hyemalis TaxID=40217 RepID=A0A8C5IT07_JUNHY
MAEGEDGGWWRSWLQQSYQAVKEKSTEALEFMKRDLAEFTQVVQHDTACTIAATASVVKDRLAVSMGTQCHPCHARDTCHPPRLLQTPPGIVPGMAQPQFLWESIPAPSQGGFLPNIPSNPVSCRLKSFPLCCHSLVVPSPLC